MASNNPRQNRPTLRRATDVSSPTPRANSIGAEGARAPERRASRASSQRSGRVKVQSRTVGEINKAYDRQVRRSRRDFESRGVKSKMALPLKIGIGVVIFVIVVFLGLFIASKTSLFTIESVEVVGADHLTQAESSALVDLPEGATLLNVDKNTIANSFKRDSWVQDIKIKRIWPSTLQIEVVEREFAAVVEVPVGETQAIQDWAISSDGIWLMAIPSQTSTIGQQLSEQIYEDAQSVLLITGVPYGVSPEIGAVCTDSNILNALEIVSGMTTDLSTQVKKVTATDAESTLLTLDSGIEIAFGTAENIRDKERIVQEIISTVPNVVYINVRVTERPTWRAA